MAQRVAYLIEQHPHTSFFFAFGAGKSRESYVTLKCRYISLPTITSHRKYDLSVTGIMLMGHPVRNPPSAIFVVKIILESDGLDSNQMLKIKKE